MEFFEITYKVLKSNDFQAFIKKTNVHLSQSVKSGNFDKQVYKIINKLLGGGLTYFLDYETVHSVVHSAFTRIAHVMDTQLLNDLIPYTVINYSRKDEKMIERMKMDVIMLLMLRGQQYYQLAWNDWDSVNLISVKGFRHLGKGIWNGIKNRNAMAGFAYGCTGFAKEKYRMYAIGLNNIRLLIMLYLYGVFSITENIEYTSTIILYLCTNGYTWLTIPAEPETNILKDYLSFIIPNSIPGIENVDLMHIYMNAEDYRASLISAYPGASETMLKEIQFF